MTVWLAWLIHDRGVCAWAFGLVSQSSDASLDLVLMVSSEELQLVLRRLVAMKAPKAGVREAVKLDPTQVLLTLVVLVATLKDFNFEAKYDVIDYFAGAGRFARSARLLGLSAAALDIGYHPNSRVFDINSDPGFALLPLNLV